ncbi:MAG TPA: hypothetical protein VFC35_05065 [Gemmatimonadaceae bacterium]|nr:hypothetical protein [Gemmatimonadaceae bacterium]
MRIHSLLSGLLIGAALPLAAQISPGVRAAFNFASGLQIVPGIAFPIGVGPSSGERGAFIYLSFEHPFNDQGRPH